MKIIDATWTPKVNMLTIECACGHQWGHRSDRWRVWCAKCGATESLGVIRGRYTQTGATP